MPISAQGVQGVKDVLDKTVKDGFPGLVFSAVDKSGNVLVQHAAGTLGVGNQTPMSSDDTIFWMASCTKLVTAIAVLQLVEQGKVPLDDTDFVRKVLPEIKDKKVYADGINAADQEKDVTVRMLLAHTAGFGYSFIDPRLKIDHGGLEGQFGDKNDILNGRLVNQPGSMWEYGVSCIHPLPAHKLTFPRQTSTGQALLLNDSPAKPWENILLNTSCPRWALHQREQLCSQVRKHKPILRDCTSATLRAK